MKLASSKTIGARALEALWLLGLALLVAACGKGKQEAEVSRFTLSGVECTEGRVACGDACVRVDSSPDNCGGCGNVCAPGRICDQSSCQPLERGCSGSLSLCGAACVDAASDRENCGGCGQQCPEQASCEQGICICPGTETACGSECVDTQTNELNCGTCGEGCVDTQTCEAGACVCPTGGELCEGSCVDLGTDAKNCGACGEVCSGGQICETGACACPSSQTLCGGSCVELETSNTNCGACGTACGGGQLCDAGSCECPEGQGFCEGKCIDLQGDSANCGACGATCTFGDGCSAGACTSGALGTDGCQGLASNLTISQVAAYQTVKSEIARDGTSVAPDTSVVAGRTTLVRVFVTPGPDWVTRELSARLHLENGDTIDTQYSESQLNIAGPSSDDDRTSAFEFKVAANLITGDTRYAVEVVECGAGQAGAELVSPRFPASDGVTLGAVDTGTLRIHIVPMRTSNGLPDISEDALALYRTAFLATYPISGVEFTLGEAFDVADPEDWSNNLDSIRALRQQEAPDLGVYYYGMLKPADTLQEFCGNGCVAGIGYIPPGSRGAQNAAGRAAMGLAYADSQSAFTMLHEVGHNHGRQHSPCVPNGSSIAGVDPNFPYTGALIGVYGYVSVSDQLIPPDGATDVMGYCNNQWFSDYTYRGLMSTVLAVNQAQASLEVEASRIGSWRVMLIDPIHGSRWGIPIPGPAVAAGEAELATVRDAAGNVIRSVTVYRTEVSDLGSFSIEVAEPDPGWRSIEVAGAPALDFKP